MSVEPLTTLVCKDIKSPIHRFGSASYRGITDDAYVEATIEVDKIAFANGLDGKYGVTFEIRRRPDIVHTFVLHSTEEIIFDDYYIDNTLETKPFYKEGMTFEINKLLADASGWKCDKHTVPLMVRETVDPYNCYIPLLRNNTSAYRVHVRGLTSLKATKALKLKIDTVFLERPARRELANEPNLSPMYVCNYDGDTFSTETTAEGFGSFKVVDSCLGQLRTVTGLVIKQDTDVCSTPIRNLSVLYNGNVAQKWEETDRFVNYDKVGLHCPSETSGNVMFIPFSRKMWTSPETSGFVDFNRIDDITIQFNGLPDQKYSFTVTGLAYTIVTTLVPKFDAFSPSVDPQIQTF